MLFTTAATINGQYWDKLLDKDSGIIKRKALIVATLEAKIFLVAVTGDPEKYLHGAIHITNISMMACASSHRISDSSQRVDITVWTGLFTTVEYVTGFIAYLWWRSVKHWVFH